MCHDLLPGVHRMFVTPDPLMQLEDPKSLLSRELSQTDAEPAA